MKQTLENVIKSKISKKELKIKEMFSSGVDSLTNRIIFPFVSNAPGSITLSCTLSGYPYPVSTTTAMLSRMIGSYYEDRGLNRMQLDESLLDRFSKSSDDLIKYALKLAVIPIYKNQCELILVGVNGASEVKTSYSVESLYEELIDRLHSSYKGGESVDRRNLSEIVKGNAPKGSKNTETYDYRSAKPSDKESLSEIVSRVDYSYTEEFMNDNLIGHKDLISKVVAKIKSRRLNLGKKSPLSFLFAGESGTGKTEFGLLLAQAIGAQTVRLDMSEYQSPHEVSKIIGSPNGYVGYGEDGALDSCNNMFSVVIIDEIEKAHPDVLDVFLQALDYGVITRGGGGQIDFSKCIFFFTSNIGSDKMIETSIGISAQVANSDFDVYPQLKKRLKPEFLNRISMISTFNPLTEENRALIYEKMVSGYIQKLEENHSLTFIPSKEIRDRVLIESNERGMGARPIDRCIEKYILSPLSDQIDQFTNGGVIKTEIGSIKVRRI